MKDYRHLEIWNRSHQITLALYKMTARFPREELFGLTSQIRRAAASIGANIAEGCGRRGDGEFHRFLQMASGSASELDYHLLLAHDLHMLDAPTYRRIGAELSRLRRQLTALLLKVDVDRQQPNANRQ